MQRNMHCVQWNPHPIIFTVARNTWFITRETTFLKSTKHWITTVLLFRICFWCIFYCSRVLCDIRMYMRGTIFFWPPTGMKEWVYSCTNIFFTILKVPSMYHLCFVFKIRACLSEYHIRTLFTVTFPIPYKNFISF